MLKNWVQFPRLSWVQYIHGPTFFKYLSMLNGWLSHMCFTFIWQLQIKCYVALIPRFGSCHLVLGNKLEKWNPKGSQESQICSLPQSLQSLQQSSLVSWLLVEVHRGWQLEENLEIAPKFSQKYVSVKITRQKMSTLTWQQNWFFPTLLVVTKDSVSICLGEFTLSYFLHTRAFGTYLLGAIYLAEKIIRWWYFTCIKLENIICDGILHVNMFHYFKIPYFMCTFFTKFTYNEYIGPCFFNARCSTIFASDIPEAFALNSILKM
jgi:hypothetical protein